MDAQKYLDSLIDECKIYSNKSVEYKEYYIKSFPDISDSEEIKEVILAMNDEQLFEYFKSSQLMVDLQTYFNKISSFIYFCKNINIELNLEKLNDINSLTNFVSNMIPFNTENTITSEGEIKEKNIQGFKNKFEEFKNSLNKVINVI